MYKDKVVRCKRCGNEVPAVPVPDNKCRECSHDTEKLTAFNTACDALLDKLPKGGLDLIKQWHKEGSKRYVSLIYF